MKILKLTLLLIAAFLLLALFLPKKTIAPTKIAPTEAIKQQVRKFELTVKNNKLISGLDVLKVNQGDIVEIFITADADGELHLHGYDKSVEYKKDKQAILGFTADKSGRFPYELENTKTEIGALEVLPR